MTGWAPAVASTTLTTLRVVRVGWWRMAVLLVAVTAASSLLVVLGFAVLRAIAALMPPPLTPIALQRTTATVGIAAVVLQWLLTVPAVVLGQGAAVLVASDALARVPLSLPDETRRLTRRAPALFAGFALYAAAIGALVLLSAPTIFAAMFAAPLGVVALALYVFVRPLRRRAWLWLTLFLLPFGLPIYYGVRWSMWCVAVVDGAGPLAAIRDSDVLVRDRWLLVAVVIAVGGAIVLGAETLVIAGLSALTGTSDPAAAGGVAAVLDFVALAALSAIPFALLAVLYFALRGEPPAPTARRTRRASRG